MSVIPNSEEIHLSGGGVAILMIHGFTGSPVSVRPWAESLHQSGFTVLVPKLPGHGTNWQEMNETRWQQWYAEIDRALDRLIAKHERVFVAGFSMGGALALRLAAQRGREIEGMMLVNPAVQDDRMILKFVPILKYFIPSVGGRSTDVAAPNPPKHSYGRTPLHALHSLQKLWREVRRELHLVDVPLMVGYSINDHVVDPKNSETVIDNVSSIDIREVIFERSFHNVALDYDLELLVEESLNFMKDVLAGDLRRDENDLIDAEFAAIVSGLSLDESSPSTFLEELESSEFAEKYKGDNKPLPKLTQIQRGALIGVIGGPVYAAAVQFLNFDPLGLGAWPGAIALVAGVFTFFWQMKPEEEIDDDGVAI
ncbi:MAG: alpha/beta fold hydrolase [Candidatus Nanopelagicaceae bacterium]|nr:alpha/beta fold hydrolase [Candidatus Nanopelagicaceae bacterium]